MLKYLNQSPLQIIPPLHKYNWNQQGACFNPHLMPIDFYVTELPNPGSSLFKVLKRRIIRVGLITCTLLEVHALVFNHPYPPPTQFDAIK